MAKNTFGAYNIEDLRQKAKRRLPRGIFEYIDRGAEDEIALRNNREAYRSLKIRNRVLKDVSQRSTATEIFGKPIAMPFGISPTASAGLAAEGGEVQVQAGQHFDGEDSLKVAANAGFAIGDMGFVNASLEYIDNDALSRGIQRPDAQALIDSGVSEVGQDAPFGDAPLVQTWGRPQTDGTRFFVNSGFDISASSQLYARFSLAETDGRYRFFYRSPTHSSERAWRRGSSTRCLSAPAPATCARASPATSPRTWGCAPTPS